MSWRRRSLLAAVCLVVLIVPSITAQEPGRLGLVVTTSSAGVIWRVTDRIAIRQDMNVTTTSIGPDASQVSTWNVGAALSGLFYIKRLDPVRVYFSPRYEYAHSRLSVNENGTTLLRTGSTVHNIAGSIGAEYAMHRHFGVFAETGVNRNNGVPATGTTGQPGAGGPTGGTPVGGGGVGRGGGPAPVPVPVTVTRYSVAARTAFGLIVFF